MCLGISLLTIGRVAAEQRGPLPRGGSYVLLPDASIATAAVDLWFRAPAIGFGSTPVPGTSRLAATAIAASKPLLGESLSARVAQYGGRIALSVYPDAVSIGVSVPADRARDILGAMTTAYFSPVLTQDGLTRGLQEVARATLERNFKPDETLHDLLFEQIFDGGPAHYATLPGKVSDLQKIGMPQVQGFAERAFRAQNAVLTVTGNVDSSVLSGVNAGRGNLRGPLHDVDAPYDSSLASAQRQTARPFSEDGLGLGWVGPPITDEQAATALDFIADYLFRSETGVAQTAVLAADPDIYLSGQFITLHNPGVMLVTIAGKNRAAARKIVDESITKMSQPLDARAFAAAKAAFLYHILSDLETPLSQADNFGWYAVEGNAAYAPDSSANHYFSAVQALTPRFVADVAHKYLSNPSVVTLTATESK